MEGLHNLKDRICDMENLIGAYRDAARDKRYRDEVLAFTRDLAGNLDSIRQDLLDREYKVGPYREFYVRYPKPRLVMALGFRDRVVQWAVYRQINPYLDGRFIHHSYGCRKGKGTLAAAEALENWIQLASRKPDAGDWYIVKMDVSKFFYRVDHGIMQAMYREKISGEPWFGWLMDTIINNPDVPFGLPVGVSPDHCPREARLFDVGMPIGNLTSQETANLYLDSLDQYIKHVLRVHYYVRYMDDFCMIVKGKAEARRLYEAIRAYLKDELRLDMSKKSCIQKVTAPVEFVGYLLSPHDIRLRKKTSRHIKRALRHVMDAYAAWEIDYDRAWESMVSYIGMCKRVKGHNLERWIEENFILQRGEAVEQREQ